MSRAPVDSGMIKHVVAPLGESRTLPADAYTSAEVFEWEREHFFEATWICAGRSSDLAAPGDQKAIRAGREGVLLIQGADGVLRGFYNACRHRAHELLPPDADAVNHRVVKCPYHAWVYGLDGSLLTAPRFGELADDDPVREGLVPAAVQEWHGWVFVNASGTAQPLVDFVGNLDGFIEPYDPGSLAVAATHEYEVAANWKIVVENYHECYHCTSIHPELCRITPPDSGHDFEPDGAWAGGSMDLRDHAETMSLSGASSSRPLRGLSGEALRHVFYFGLFPNFLISPHPDYVLTHLVEPLAPDRSRIECRWLYAAEEVGRDGFDPSGAVEFWDITNRQDWAACESVQRGVASRGYRQGPLAKQEGDVHQFLCMVANGYLDGVVSKPRIRERMT